MAEYINRDLALHEVERWEEGITVNIKAELEALPQEDVVDRSEYEKLKIENTELKIKYADAEKRFCNAMDKNAKLCSKLDKAIEKIVFLRQHKAKYITEDRKICIDSGEVLKILQKCTEE